MHVKTPATKYSPQCPFLRIGKSCIFSNRSCSEFPTSLHPRHSSKTYGKYFCHMLCSTKSINNGWNLGVSDKVYLHWTPCYKNSHNSWNWIRFCRAWCALQKASVKMMGFLPKWWDPWLLPPPVLWYISNTGDIVKKNSVPYVHHPWSWFKAVIFHIVRHIHGGGSNMWQRDMRRCPIC